MFNTKDTGLKSNSDRAVSEEQLFTRRKQWAPKVRTGCQTCRTRRVKCDEAKPRCWRCQRIEATCDYGRRTNMFGNPPGQRTNTHHASMNRSLEPLCSLVPVFGSAEESRYLDYYLHFSTSWFGRYSEASLFRGTVPRRAWNSASVRHALVAVAMASEQYCCSALYPSTHFHRRFWHYNQALRYLYSDQSADPDVALLCCVLFWLHDNIVNDVKSAMTHLTGFVQLLVERKQKKIQSKASHELEMCVQYTMIYWSHSVDSCLVEHSNPDVIARIFQRLDNPNYKQSFSNIDSARSEISLAIRAIPWIEKIHSHFNDHDHNCRSTLTYCSLRRFIDRWFVTFSTIPGISPIDHAIIECHYWCLILIIRARTERYDQQQLEDIQSLACLNDVLDKIELLGLHLTSATPAYTRASAPGWKDLKLTMPVIPLLAEVSRLAPTSTHYQPLAAVTNQQREQPQDRALRLLGSMNRVEGIMHSNIVFTLLTTTKAEKSHTGKKMTAEKVLAVKRLVEGCTT